MPPSLHCCLYPSNFPFIPVPSLPYFFPRPYPLLLVNYFLYCKRTSQFSFCSPPFSHIIIPFTFFVSMPITFVHFIALSIFLSFTFLSSPSFSYPHLPSRAFHSFPLSFLSFPVFGYSAYFPSFRSFIYLFLSSFYFLTTKGELKDITRTKQKSLLSHYFPKKHKSRNKLFSV